LKIAVIGAGYVGLVSGVCFSDFGYEVVVVDKEPSRVAQLERGEIPIYEPGLDELVHRNTQAGRLTFSTSIAAAVKGAEVIFIAVGTPSRRGDGFADLSYVYGAADEIAGCLSGPCVVACKSTVPVGTNREILRRILAIRPGFPVDVASNPEFLREGAAIQDFKRPDRVVVGAETDRAREVMRNLYRPLSLNETPILFTALETAELTKYAANAFLATKITFINEMADLCERVGANVQDVARGIGLDGRIGSKFLHAGPGYGGSCFPKDTTALVSTARSAGSPLRIVETVVAVNEARKQSMADRVAAAFAGDLSDRTIAVLGLTFKPNTDDMRDAPSLTIVPALQAAGARVRAHDPQGMDRAAELLPGVDWCDGPYHAAEGADAVVIITEWDAYRALDLVRLKRLLKGDLFFDLRNVYKSSEVASHGFRHFPVGIGQEIDQGEEAAGMPQRSAV
jgi:UDPglucose 6-dehydrogenase